MVDPNKNEEIHEAQPDTGQNTALKDYGEIEAKIRTLADELKDKVYNLDKVVGLEDAKRDRTRWVKIRTGIEKLRTLAKRQINEKGKRIDGEARRLTAISQPHEDALNEKINAKIEEKARAKAERERLAAEERERQEQVERDRIARDEQITKNIAMITRPLEYGSTLDDAQRRQRFLKAMTLGPDDFGDRIDEGIEALDMAMTTINVIVEDLEIAARERRELAELRERQAKEEARREVERQEQAERDAAEEAAKAAAEQEAEGEPAPAAATTSAPSPETTEPAGETAKAVDGTMGPGDELVGPPIETVTMMDEAPDPRHSDGTPIFPPMVAGEYVTKDEIDQAVTDENGNSPEQARALAAASRLNGPAAIPVDENSGQTQEVAHRDLNPAPDNDLRCAGGGPVFPRDSADVPTGAFVDAYMVLRVAAGEKWLDVPTAATTKEAALKKADILDLRPHEDQRPWLSRQVVMVHIKEVG